ncbi:RNA-dependent ATPase [Komagataella phaffii CBS 7435]|uniref:ATP-dependent RNA helicase DBP3 n=2 Tax=Komagataella phaffii TaxID=460519 RepID=C4QZF6_KOMPG|nr:Putative ATP-dependent RNA helicase of the DEAD-box family involved in ribosomal biogenesis [Komagataella phaffii GS115]AOA62297.1 GQ67_00055T0 [Komagataella phaffii]CAH2448874.1 RNA-dependent ATPase [Komagataella phaffii CBS 7435]AOA67479.1 GQ68_01332T0 [Komagataella phaffii GS115]CAY68630.1 Putative ATP-dependent RNA helicase of the DEAD-box family involved in ribosomal biogenesis [Komagataella phaffii GS115]CCA38951.1 RNA-dependent ATPase [Komagataella phaffii CBS 7435]
MGSELKASHGEKIKKEKKEKKEKKVKKDKKVKKEKKEKREKKDKKEKKEKKEKDHNETPQPATEVDQATIDAYLKENEISIDDPHNAEVSPILNFSMLQGIEEKIKNKISQFDKPTTIQAVSWPYLLKGNDVIGVAETGSGKTFAFGVPAISHVLQKNSKGLQVLVISPTRELAVQIYDNLKQLTDLCGLECCCIYGGVSKDDQRRQVKQSQCVIATPGRLLDLMEEGSIDLTGINYLVLDEADRMLEKGFEEAIKSIMANVNTDRQTLMFTATWPKEVRELASHFMKSPVKVTVGDRDELSANKKITQIVEVIDPYDKEKKLLQLLSKYSKNDDKILIFALYKKEATRVERTLNYKGYKVSAIHGDLSQQQRTQSLNDFKTGKSSLLLATDVAARGLDIPNVKVVINLTFPLTVEDYVHRIGRTGRAGKTGIAHTLFTEHEKHLSGALQNILRGANQPVPEELLKFGGHTKRKEHSVYGAFFKDVDMNQKAKKIKFD